MTNKIDFMREFTFAFFWYGLIVFFAAYIGFFGTKSHIVGIVSAVFWVILVCLDLTVSTHPKTNQNSVIVSFILWLRLWILPLGVMSISKSNQGYVGQFSKLLAFAMAILLVIQLISSWQKSRKRKINKTKKNEETNL